ncbi:MAG: TonB-dependent hemoglobin/transferrin/lactoferrin family receptor [Cellvibrionaceae bacterium]|nr:TonB-dependent hemoglobin/transferrin/lactoferrin family receptor [Cellvibrionaceae bacterium]
MTFQQKTLALMIGLAIQGLAVAAEQEDGKQVFTLDKVTVAATLNEEKVADVASSVTIVDAEEVERHNAKDIRQMLRFETGVEVEGGGRFGLSGFNIRGMNENRVKIIVDGVEQAKSFIPGGDFQRITRNTFDIDSLKQVEIVKGPASPLYGSDAIGGVVSFTTKDPADYLDDGDDCYGDGKLMHASVDESNHGTLTLACRQGAVEALLIYTRRDGGETENRGEVGGSGSGRTLPNPTDYTDNNLLAKLQWQLNSQHRLEFVAERFNSESDSSLETRNNYNDYSPYFGPGNFLSYTNSRADDEDERSRLGIRHIWQGDNALFDDMQWSVDWQQSSSNQKTIETLDASPLVQRIFRILPGDRIKDYSHDQDNVDWQFRFNKEAGVHGLTYGLNYETVEIDNITNTLYQSAAENNTTGGYIPGIDAESVGVFIQDKISLMNGQWTVTPSIRYDNFEADPKTAGDLDHDSSKTSFGLGTVFKFSDTVSLFGQFSQGFKAPEVYNLYYNRDGGTYAQLANPNLEAEEVDAIELGLRFQGALGEAEITAFYNQYDQFIANRVVSVEPPYTNGVTQYVNVAEAKIKGAEARASLYLDEALAAPLGATADISVSYADGEGRDGSAEAWRPLNTITPLKAVLGLHYDEPQGRWGSSLSWTLSAAKDVDDVANPNSALSSGYGVLDLTAYYQLNEDLIIRAGVFNLSDKNYSTWDDLRGSRATSKVLDRYTQPGRNFNVSIKYTFM